jgi:hypothetical protein
MNNLTNIPTEIKYSIYQKKEKTISAAAGSNIWVLFTEKNHSK